MEIIVLFGEMGGGKNYWGERIAAQKGYHFYDGDAAAPPIVVERVMQFKMLRREHIRLFVDVLCEEIVRNTPPDASGMVVAQALYFDEDRKYLAASLQEKGFNVRFQWIRTPFWRNLRQVYSRPKGMRWAIYWLRNKRWFEHPTHEYTLLR
jgi:gluconate kinase